MKKLHLSSLVFGVIIGLVIAGTFSTFRPALAQDTPPAETSTPPAATEPTPQPAPEAPKAPALSEAEVDQKLQEVLDDQAAMKKRLGTILTQTQFLKASSGK